MWSTSRGAFISSPKKKVSLAGRTCRSFTKEGVAQTAITYGVGGVDGLRASWRRGGIHSMKERVHVVHDMVSKLRMVSTGRGRGEYSRVLGLSLHKVQKCPPLQLPFPARKSVRHLGRPAVPASFASRTNVECRASHMSTRLSGMDACGRALSRMRDTRPPEPFPWADIPRCWTSTSFCFFGVGAGKGC